MTSWGRPPTDKQYTIPVARRRSPRDPVKLEWVPSVDWEGNPLANVSEARFEHRDARIWAFVMSPIEDSHTLGGLGYRQYIQGTSSGCEPVRFAAQTVRSGRRAVERFANMAIDNYQVLTADAEGTSDHPMNGSVALITIRTERRVRRSHVPSDYDIEYDQEERTGRVNGSKIMLFPTQDEINEVLETVLDSNTEIVERLIEEHAIDVDIRSRRSAPTTSAPMQRPIVTGAIYQSRRQFGAAAAAMDAQCAPPAREERSIQL